ncbi:MAG: hypothetical protein NZ570_00935, partial [Candidatus Caldarchaeum sp.]|nr:hypothetical protein [Candidatus Caldarchaeum sp.]
MSEHFERAWKTILSSPSMYRKGFKAGVEAVHGLRLGSFSKVVILGVGGSGIVGDVVASLKEPGCEAEVLPIKDIKAPHRCGPETLVIAVSYSGNTAETLHAAVDSLNKRAKVVGVSTGGRLTSFLESRGFSVVRVSEGYEPRYAVPEMVGAVYGLLSSVSGFQPEAFEKA